MPIIDLVNREQLDGPARHALEQLLANLTGYLYTEHDDEGGHGDVTADSLTLREGGSVTLPNGSVLSIVDGVPTLTDGLTLSGELTSAGAVNSGGQVYSGVDTYAISGTTNLAYNGDFAGRVTVSTAAPKLGGIVGGVDGSFFYLTNTTATAFEIQHDSSGTFSVSQILCPGEIHLTVPPAGSVLLWYDGTSNRWRVVATSVHEGIYADYTPTWTTSGTQPTLGTGGTIVGKYTQVGKLVNYKVQITLGTGFTFGTGTMGVTLPVAIQNSANPSGHHHAYAIDISVPDLLPLLSALRTIGGSPLPSINQWASPMATITTTAPVTWAAGDIIRISGTYEAT